MTNIVNSAYPLSIQWAEVQTNELLAQALRLDASSYCTEARAWKTQYLDRETWRLDEIARVYQPVIFGKREMIGSAKQGIPLYSSSEMLMVDPEPAFYLSGEFEMKVRSSLGIEQGIILVTRSGTVGNILYVTSDRDGFLVDDHMIRIIPSSSHFAGLIYTFLSSPVGQSVLRSFIYGAVQNEINGQQVASIRIPVVEEHLARTLNQKIVESAELRAEADKLLKDVNTLIYEVNGLPAIDMGNAEWLDPARNVEAVSVSSSDLGYPNNSGSAFRLDAHFYNPMARLARRNLQSCSSDTKTLDSLAERIFFGSRSKRNYVNPDHGTPFLSGRNIVQIRPSGLKYVSNSQTDGLEDSISLCARMEATTLLQSLE